SFLFVVASSMMWVSLEIGCKVDCSENPAKLNGDKISLCISIV
ncbi:4174_t:CDS:1, partial [Gigaspora rosea]